MVALYQNWWKWKSRTKKSGYNFDTNIHWTFPQLFSPNILKRPKCNSRVMQEFHLYSIPLSLHIINNLGLHMNSRYWRQTFIKLSNLNNNGSQTEKRKTWKLLTKQVSHVGRCSRGCASQENCVNLEYFARSHRYFFKYPLCCLY